MARHNNSDASVVDRISALPDDLIHGVMAFLTAQEAVQTCVLSRRWQNLWASLRCLNIDAAKFTSLEQFKKFVDDLLLKRASTPLDTLWLRAIFDSPISDHFSDYSEIRPWVNHALKSNAQVLGLVPDGNARGLVIEGVFTSLHLKRLHLCNFAIYDEFVEKLSSGCPVLEELELIRCRIHAAMFSSTTLKRFTITDPHIKPYGYLEDFKINLVIDMPNLVSLYIDILSAKNPYLGDVSSLKTASIDLYECSLNNSDVDCNMLSALSSAMNLESLSLTVHDNDLVRILASDVRRCGSFSNLKNLSLGEWCLSFGCSALLHLLRCSPKIEKLTLNLTDDVASHFYQPGEHTALETDPDCNETEMPFNCESLKIIEMNCPEGDKRVHVVIGILLASITSPAEISIKPLAT